MYPDIDFVSVVKQLRKHYAEDCEAAINSANDSVEKKFIFNQRWDMERTWEYVEFDKEIDFLHQPGGDPEWVFAFNRLKHFISLGQAYHLTNDEKYANAFKEQMKSWIENVVEDDEKNEKAWRTIETGIRLDTMCKAWLYFRNTKQAKEIEDIFLESINTHAESILKRSWNSYHLLSNWGVLSNHGLYVAGIVFSKPEWEKEALYRLSEELKNQVYDDGTHWEQSPMYHNEVTRDYLDVLLLSIHGTIKIEDWFIEKVKLLALVNLKWMKPNGSEPLMGDSDDIDIRDVISESAYIFKDAEMKAISYSELDYETSWLVGMDGIKDYQKIEAKIPEKLDFFLEDSGNGFSRNSWKENADYIRFHNGTIGSGHGHADQTHFSIVAGGKDLLVDAGRYTYVAGENRYRFKNNFAHNVVTVDGKSLYPEKDSWECYSLDKTVNTRASFKGDYVAFEGGHLGYYKEGVFINRKVTYLKDARLVIVIDEIYSDKFHEYESRYNLAEDIIPLIDDKDVKISNVNLKVRSFKEFKISETNGQISRHYNKWEETKAIRINTESEGFLSIWSVFDLSGEKDLEVELHPVKSWFKGITFRPAQIESITIKGKDREYLVVCAHEEYATPTDSFKVGEDIVGFGVLNVFNLAKGEKTIGKRIFF